MESIVADFHLLTSIGAGFFALSFIRGAQGRLRQSVWMAALSAVLGIIAAADSGALGASGLGPLVVIGANVGLALFAVIGSRKLFLSERSND